MTVHYSITLEEKAIELDGKALLLLADGFLPKNWSGCDVQKTLTEAYPDKDVFYFSWYPKPEKYIIYFVGSEKSVLKRFSGIPRRAESDNTGL